MNKVSITDKDKDVSAVKKNELSEFKKMQYIRCPVKAIIINNNLFKGEW